MGGRRREGRVENERAWRWTPRRSAKRDTTWTSTTPTVRMTSSTARPKNWWLSLIETEKELLRLYEELQREIDGFVL